MDLKTHPYEQSLLEIVRVFHQFKSKYTRIFRKNTRIDIKFKINLLCSVNFFDKRQTGTSVDQALW